MPMKSPITEGSYCPELVIVGWAHSICLGTVLLDGSASYPVKAGRKRLHQDVHLCLWSANRCRYSVCRLPGGVGG